jgi:hypothetical protein
MFRFIRWRLVISYMLLTLVTVSAVGVLASGRSLATPRCRRLATSPPTPRRSHGRPCRS